MSDFSVGFFTRDAYKEKVYPHLTEYDLLIQYNESWIGKLSDADWQQQPQLQNLTLSKEVPLMYVMNAEDHGFSMKIFHEEEVKFTLDISYDIYDKVFNEVAHELYGEDCWEVMMSSIGTDDNKMDAANERTEKRLKDENILETETTKALANINNESLKIFGIFGFEGEVLQNLKQILTVENGVEDSRKMVGDLLDCLGLAPLEFVSYDYLSRGGDDRFEVLNWERRSDFNHS